MKPSHAFGFEVSPARVRRATTILQRSVPGIHEVLPTTVRIGHIRAVENCVYVNIHVEDGTEAHEVGYAKGLLHCAMLQNGVLCRCFLDNLPRKQVDTNK
jgi:hypothetical protein